MAYHQLTFHAQSTAGSVNSNEKILHNSRQPTNTIRDLVMCFVLIVAFRDYYGKKETHNIVSPFPCVSAGPIINFYAAYY